MHETLDRLNQANNVGKSGERPLFVAHHHKKESLIQTLLVYLIRREIHGPETINNAVYREKVYEFIYYKYIHIRWFA
jgi:hypothetical protein